MHMTSNEILNALEGLNPSRNSERIMNSLLQGDNTEMCVFGCVVMLAFFLLIYTLILKLVSTGYSIKSSNSNC